MSLIALFINLLLAGLLTAALVMGWRLNRRLSVLRDSHDGFEAAVRDLNTAAARAEMGLADLRAATDEATDLLADRIEKGRALVAQLERLTQTSRVPSEPAAATSDAVVERRLGALLAAHDLIGWGRAAPSPSVTQMSRRPSQGRISPFSWRQGAPPHALDRRKTTCSTTSRWF